VRIGPGTRALVTGASRGIGRALAEALASRGASVGLMARSGEELDQLASRLPGTHHPLVADAGDREAVEAAVRRFVEAAGGLDLAVANAGVADYGPFRDMTVEAVERMTRINWLGTVYLVAAVLPGMLERSEGHIVIVSSGAGHRSFPQAAAYGATKAAQRMFGEALRHELADTGVSLTMVYPGEIATDLHAHDKDAMPAWYHGGQQAAAPERLAEKVIGGVEEDARAVYYPRLVRILGAAHGVSPRASDAMLRRLRGRTAAPRRD
jgi:3-oxoacyl-[acyl-carrier protein] reductase